MVRLTSRFFGIVALAAGMCVLSGCGLIPASVPAKSDITSALDSWISAWAPTWFSTGFEVTGSDYIRNSADGSVSIDAPSGYSGATMAGGVGKAISPVSISTVKVPLAGDVILDGYIETSMTTVQAASTSSIYNFNVSFSSTSYPKRVVTFSSGAVTSLEFQNISAAMKVDPTQTPKKISFTWTSGVIVVNNSFPIDVATWTLLQ